MKRKLSLTSLIFPLLLVAIALYLSFRNYTPGTFLIGWDSLHPEFNFGLAFQRLFFGFWREDQGVGLLTVHSHMSDLPRVILLWLSSIVLPISLLRYFYIFLCMVLGPLGAYFLLKYIFEREKTGLVIKLTSFLGALSYLLNLVTLQHFFVPFEMFTTQFAFLPWLFLFAVKILREGKKKNYLWFAIFTLLALPMAYAATLFYAYLGALVVFLLIYIVLNKFRPSLIKKSFLVLVIALALNLFWLSGNVYSVLTQTNDVANSRINYLFSPEATIRNQAYGDLGDIALGKNFLFDWRAFDNTNNTYTDLMNVWIKHLEVPGVKTIGYLIFAFSVLGIIFSLVKKNKFGIVFFFVYLYALFFLINSNFPTGSIYQFFVNHSTLFKEGFRMTFTKFSIIFELCQVFFFAYFVLFLLNLIKGTKFRAIVGVILASLLSFGIYSFTKPAFSGNFISQVVRTDFPNEYFQIFHWFNQNPEGRIADLPMQTLWGWGNHNWKYEGSGFLPFGLKDPLLDRDFDRFSPFNETFYNQANFALYQYQIPDPNLKLGKEELATISEENKLVITNFENVLQKFQVRYLLLDESVINAGGDNKILYIPQIKDLVANSAHIKEAAKFGFLTIYQTDFDFGNDFVSAPANYSLVNAETTYSQLNTISNYGTTIQNDTAVGLPFSDFDRREGLTYQVKNTLEGERLVIENPKMKVQALVTTENATKEDFSKERGFKEAYNCDLMKNGTVAKLNLVDKVDYKAADGGVSCDFYYYPDISYSQAYVLRVKGENVTGRSLKIYLQNLTTGKMDLEELMDPGNFDNYFVILPKNIEVQNPDYSGYYLNVETRSFSGIASENKIEKIEFYPIPFGDLLKVKTSQSEPEKIVNNLQVLEVKKSGTSAYKVDVQGYGLISLGQGFENGWIAFTENGSKYKKLDHVLVNGWKNGWIVPSNNQSLITNNETILIVFWPQYLEWSGMVLIPLTVILILGRRKHLS